MRLLVTRPRGDAECFAAVLSEHGHEAVVAPVMELRLLDGPPLAFDGVQAILATSANGVRAIARRVTRRGITLFAVGPQTAEEAVREGFATVVNAEGDSAALVEKVCSLLDPAQGKIWHAAGAESTGRVRQNLQARGFEVDSVTLYEAAPVSQLPVEACAALAAQTLDGVFLFSPRSAKIFSSLVAAAELGACCVRLDAYCISAATAAALGGVSFARVAVAGEPNQQAMLELLSTPSEVQ